jgi:AI-2 transport protein TqsA
MIKEFPFYIKVPVILLGLVISVYILLVLRDILVPLAFASLIAILLNPLSNRLERRVPKVLAIVFSMLIAIFTVTALMYFLSSQVAHFFDDLDSIEARLSTLLHDIQVWLQTSLWPLTVYLLYGLYTLLEV